MGQNYFSKNTDSLKFTTNSHPLSFCTTTKEKQHKTKTLVTFLSLFLVLFLEGNLSAQTTLFSSGFETTDTAFTSSITTGTITQPFTGNAYTGTKSGQITSPSGDTYSGSIITPTINFVNGRWYTITVWANVIQWQGILRIVKSTSNTNTAMTSATGGDRLLWPISNNVTSETYNQYSVTFQATATETKYIGFYMSTTSSGNNRFGKMNIDDISIIENTTLPITYCAPSVSSGYESLYYIKKVNFIGNITNSDNASTYNTSPRGYQDQTALGTRASQAQGEGVNIYVDTNVGDKANYAKAWVDWDKNGIFNESTEIVYQCTNAFINTTFGFKIPETTIQGNYRIRIRINRSNSTADNTFDACGNIVNYGETEDYLFTVVANCAAKITSITNGFNCGTDRVTLGAVGTAGSTQYRWYDAQTGGTLVETTASTTWLTPSISTSKTFYVTAFNGICESLFRTPVLATIKPIPTLTFANANPEVCGENSIIDLQASGNNEQVYLIDENFESGLGSFTNNNIATQDAAKTNWQIQSSTYVPPYPAFPVWYPAISSGFGTNKFAMSTSDIVAGGTTFGKVENALESVTVNTNGFLNLSLSFKIYFSSYNDVNSASVEYVNVEVSTNGGVSWISTPIVQYLGDVGIGTQFVTSPNFNLNAFTGITSLKIRIRYKAGWCDGVAVDDIKLFGDKPLSPSFQWTSALPIDAYTNAACTIPYTAGTPASIVYVKPTLVQLEQSTYSFTAKANLANGCSTSAIINVTNKSKVWQNLTTDWNNSSNWKPSGVPTAANCVIIPNTSVIPGSNYNAYAKNLTVKSTGNLELPSTSNLTVTDFVNVNAGGIFNIKDKASLMQINNVANTGIVNIERITQPISKLDYTYWSSPVTLASNFTLGSLSPNSPLMFSWIPTVANGAGNWQNEMFATTMDPRKGYIVRAPNTFSNTSKTPYTANFIGTPNNGTITAPISKGTLIGITDVDAENDEWNLIGNPYPSALNAATFLNLPANVPLIDGTLYLWTHNSQPNTATIDPFYGDYVLNYTDTDYAVFNTTGGTATAPASTGGSAPTGYIASGQSFFVKAASTMANGTTANVTFNNSMRVGVEGKNSDFFKMNKNQKNEAIPKNVSDIERHRIWLNLTNNSGAFSQILVGYVSGATQDRDRSYDGELLGGNDVSFYSIIPNANLTIQGRALPFDQNDEIILGYNAAMTGELSIRIDHLDGLFGTQNIYLEDKELGTIHDLRDKPYVFQTEIGDFDDRFILRYTDKTLNVKDPLYDNAVTVFFTRTNNTLNIKNSANDNTVLTALLYNIQGKLLSKWDVKEKEQSNIKIPIQDKTSAVYIVKLKTAKGNISKKIIVK